MKRSLLLVFLCFGFLNLPVKSAESCSIYLECDLHIISCSITASPGNTVNCWIGPGDKITCCEFDSLGRGIRDIHKYCPNLPGGGPPNQ